jgi:hypothetical protein
MGVDAPAVLSIKETTEEQHLTLLTDPNQARSDLALPISKKGESPIINPIGTSTRVGLYRGWTPNMDEGWTRFVFDLFNVPYLAVDDSEMRKGELGSKFDVVVLSSQRAAQIIEGNAANSFPVEYTVASHKQESTI